MHRRVLRAWAPLSCWWTGVQRSSAACGALGHGGWRLSCSGRSLAQWVQLLRQAGVVVAQCKVEVMQGGAVLGRERDKTWHKGSRGTCHS